MHAIMRINELWSYLWLYQLCATTSASFFMLLFLALLRSAARGCSSCFLLLFRALSLSLAVRILFLPARRFLYRNFSYIHRGRRAALCAPPRYYSIKEPSARLYLLDFQSFSPAGARIDDGELCGEAAGRDTMWAERCVVLFFFSPRAVMSCWWIWPRSALVLLYAERAFTRDGFVAGLCAVIRGILRGKSGYWMVFFPDRCTRCSIKLLIW